MAKAKAPSQSSDELLRDALLSAAGEAPDYRLVKSGKSAGLFPSAAAAKKAAPLALEGNQPYLEEVRTEGAAKFVRLTPAGLSHVLSFAPSGELPTLLARWLARVPGEQAVQLVETAAARLPAEERVGLLLEAARSLPAEAAALLDAATDAARREADATRERAARMNAATDRFITALVELKTAEAETHEAAARSARAVIARLGGQPPTEPEKQPTPERHPNRNWPPLPSPDPEDADYRRQVARRLVSAWAEAQREGAEEARRYLEAAMENIDGIRAIGGEVDFVPFDGKYHQADRPVSDGASVRVRTVGWVLDQDQGEYLLLKARVE